MCIDCGQEASPHALRCWKCHVAYRQAQKTSHKQAAAGTASRFRPQVLEVGLSDCTHYYDVDQDGLGVCRYCHRIIQHPSPKDYDEYFASCRLQQEVHLECSRPMEYT